SPTVASTSTEGQNKDSSTSEDDASPNTPKPFVKFVKPKDSQYESKINKQETPKKPQVKYAEQYRYSNKKPNVKGNQRNWNNLKSYQLGPKFVLNKKACYNCGDFSHLANDCRKRVQRETSRSRNHAYMGPSHRSTSHRPHGAPMRPPHRSVGHRPHRASMRPSNRPAGHRPHVKTQYRAPWVSTINRNNPPVNRKFSTGRRNFPTVNRKFPTARRKFTTGSIKIHTADMGKKGKAVKSSACWTWNPLQKLSNKDSECIVLGRNFKLLDDTNILLRTPRRLGHLNVKIMNKLVRHNLVRGLPTKSFNNDHTCTACLKGKQHKVSCKSKTKDETSDILKKFITEIENLKDLKVKIIRTPAIGFLKPFGCHVMILNTLDNLGKFKPKGDEANQEVKKDVSSLRYIALPNWAHDALLEFSSSKPHDESSTKVPKGSGNPNSTASSSNPPADQMETLTVESPIPTISSSVPTACLNDSPKLFDKARLILKRVANKEESPSLDNILSLTNRFEDILGVITSSDEAIGVEADVNNMETTISASPTSTLRIHKDHSKSQIIGHVDTPIQTRHKSKEVEEQSFIAIVYQKIDPALFQFCLFSCFLSQVEPKKVSDAL
nr:hypothetical protein [Tanacetum cinerariifolium]